MTSPAKRVPAPLPCPFCASAAEPGFADTVRCSNALCVMYSLGHMHTTYWNTRAAAPEPPAEDGCALPIGTVDYVWRYGGRCRDCADENGICPLSGLPCGEARKAIEWVIGAINYGLKNGFLPAPPALSNKG